MTSYDTIADQVENAATALDAYEEHLFPGEPIVHRKGHEDSEVMLRSLLCDLLHYADHQQIDFARTFRIAQQIYADDLGNSRRPATAALSRPRPDPASAASAPETPGNSSQPPGIHPAALAAQDFPGAPAEGVPLADPGATADRPVIPMQRLGHRRP